jgi:hypothetical protein
MHSWYIFRTVSANVYSCFAWVSSVSAYPGSVGRKTIELAAIAAAVSAASSEPPQLASILYAGRAIGITSAGPHHLWSASPLPTWPYRTFGAGCALMK